MVLRIVFLFFSFFPNYYRLCFRGNTIDIRVVILLWVLWSQQSESGAGEFSIILIFLYETETEKRGWLYRKFNTGGINPDDPDNNLDNVEHAGMVFFRDKVGGAINNNYVKVLILLVFSVYLLGAGYGLTQIQEGLERRKLSKEDSYSVKFFDLEDEFYREFPYRMQVIVTGDLNYSDPVSDIAPYNGVFQAVLF